MPDVTLKLHRRRRQRVVFREGERGGEDASFEGCSLGALDQAFPVEHVILGAWPGDDALGAVVRQVLVLRQEPFVCCGCHVVRMLLAGGGVGRLQFWVAIFRRVWDYE